MEPRMMHSGTLSIENWGEIPGLDQLLPSKWCIFRVPETLKRGKGTEWLPQLVGLGPYHHFSPNLFYKHIHKLAAVRENLERIWSYKREANQSMRDDPVPYDGELLKLRDEIWKLRVELMGCYDEDITFAPNVFIQDSCFMLEICLKHIMGLSHVHWFDLSKDFLKLENQIPLILLKRLCTMQGLEESFVPMLCSIIETHSPFPCPIRQIVQHVTSDEESPPRHVLELMHRSVGKCFMNSHQPLTRELNDTEVEDYLRTGRITATVLINAGIQLCQTGLPTFTEERYKLKVSLGLPQIRLHRGSEVALCNLIVFEGMQGLDSSVISGLMRFMKELTETDHDVALLRRVSVIENGLGSDAGVVRLFNELNEYIAHSKHTSMDVLVRRLRLFVASESIAMGVARSIRMIFHTVINMSARKYAEYFSKPWSCIASITAAILLVCTILQTLYTIKSYKES